MNTLKIATLLTTALALTMPQAAADAQNDQFLHALAAQGIQGDPGLLIADAHAACDNWGHVWAVYGVRQNIQAHAGIGPDQAAAVINAGVRAYCPQNSGGLPPGA